MPWRPRPHDLQQLRLAKKLTPEKLAAELGLSDRWVRLVESDKAPKTMQDKNVEALCAVHRCKAEAIADWIEHPIRRGRNVKSAESCSSTRQPVEPPTEPAAPTSSKAKKTPALPKLGKLSENAKQERTLGLSEQTVSVVSGVYPLLGFDRFKLVWSRPKAHDGQRLIVQGKPDDYMGLHRMTAEALGTDDGGKFRVSRLVADGLAIYATVFAATGAHFDQLRAHLDRDVVTIVVRVVYKPASGKVKGFFFYEDGDESRETRKPAPRVPKDFAFVVEEIYPASDAQVAA